MRILISDKSSPKCAEILRSAGHEVDEKTGLSPEALKGIIGKYHGLIVRSATKVTADLLSAADKLKVIGRAGTGVDNIDLAAASARNIVVMNTPGGNSNAVAELALCQMLALGRDLYRAVHSLKEKRWDKKQFEGSEITGKTLGLLGYGRVSRLLAGKCRALGMTGTVLRSENRQKSARQRRAGDNRFPGKSAGEIRLSVGASIQAERYRKFFGAPPV